MAAKSNGFAGGSWDAIVIYTFSGRQGFRYIARAATSLTTIRALPYVSLDSQRRAIRIIRLIKSITFCDAILSMNNT